MSVEQIRHLITYYISSFLSWLSFCTSCFLRVCISSRTTDADTLFLLAPLRLQRFPEDEILEQVTSLRSKLLAALPHSGPRDPKTLKSSETHSIAQAKETELTRMRSAFGMSSNYKEGASFDREEQERLRVLKRAEYEEKDRLRAERTLALEKAEEEKREAEKKRRRDEERARKAAEKEASRRPPPRRQDSPPPVGRSARPTERSLSPPPRRRSRSPAPAGARDRSLSPPPRRARRDSSTPPRRRRAASESDSDDSRDSRSPPPRRTRDDSRERRD